MMSEKEIPVHMPNGETIIITEEDVKFFRDLGDGTVWGGWYHLIEKARAVSEYIYQCEKKLTK